MTWVCKYCDHNNDDADVECALCGELRFPASAPVASSPVPATSPVAASVPARSARSPVPATSPAAGRLAAKIIIAAGIVVALALTGSVIAGVLLPFYPYEWGVVAVVCFNVLLCASLPLYYDKIKAVSVFGYFTLVDFAVTFVTAFCFEYAALPVAINFALLAAFAAAIASSMIKNKEYHKATGVIVTAALSLAAVAVFSIAYAEGIDTDTAHAILGVLTVAVVALAAYYASPALMSADTGESKPFNALTGALILALSYIGVLLNEFTGNFYETVSTTFFAAAALSAIGIGVYTGFIVEKKNIPYAALNICFAFALGALTAMHYCGYGFSRSDYENFNFSYLIMGVFALYTVFTADYIFCAVSEERLVLAMALTAGLMFASLTAFDIMGLRDTGAYVALVSVQLLIVVAYIAVERKFGSSINITAVNFIYLVFLLAWSGTNLFAELIPVYDAPTMLLNLGQGVAAAFFVYYAACAVSFSDEPALSVSAYFVSAVVVGVSGALALIYREKLGAVIVLSAMAVVSFVNIITAAAQNKKGTALLSFLLCLTSIGFALAAVIV